MLMSNAKTYKLWKGGSTKDNLGQKIWGYTRKGTVVVSVTLANDTTLANNPRYKDIEYVGITTATNIREGDKLDNLYTIHTVIPAGRHTYLLLKGV